MADAALKEMTSDEFLVWCQSQEDRYELIDGIPWPLRGMAGASRAHDRIAVNIIAHLYQQLSSSDCIPTTPDTAVRTAIKRVRRPDVTVECAPTDANTYEARNPVAVFEILSPSTEKTDHLVKLPEYMRHPGLKTIVLVRPEHLRVVVYSRAPDGQWDSALFDQPEQKIAIAGTPAELTLAAIYAGVPLPPVV